MSTTEHKYQQFTQEVSRYIDVNRIYTDDLRLLAWGTDAGFYRMLPKVVVRAANEAEIVTILRVASKLELPVTFRAAGTSLSGQAISDSILVVAGKSWEGYRLLDDQAHVIALQPGIVGARVSEILKPYHRVFPPDPASKNSAMVGGIVANNASGMKCGTHANSDRVLRSIRIILADGTVLDTADEKSRDDFKTSHAEMIAEIEAIRDEIRNDNELYDLIKHKYSIKNVTGLNLLPFVIFDDPFEIMAHCMVGSEGTLAFISEVTMNTAEEMPYTASAMLYFQDLAEACRAVVEMRKKAPIQACELLDRKSLASVNDSTGENLTALLLQTEAKTQEQLDKQIAETLEVLKPFNLFKPAHFSSDPTETAAWWQTRSGVFPAVGGTRPLGTTSLIEDVAFHIDNLPEATVELANLLEKCGYDDACIYGHALEGNYHFVIAQSFDSYAEIDKYRHLMEEIEKLVVGKYDGSLKAEHGTGRNMAPFVEAEWGSKAWRMMKRLKKAFDPQNLLNPGVIFNDDPECFIHGMKPLPLTNRHVDKCIECGFCEVNCISCGLTLSARQRIVVQREISRLRKDGTDPERLKRLEKSFQYYGNQTCAGDGLCSTSCPMRINTSDLIHDIREQRLSPSGKKVGKWAAVHLAGVSSGLRLMLGAADIAHSVIGDKGIESIGKGLHKVGIPLWTPSLPAPYSPKKISNEMQPEQERKLVYFPSCINRTMGESKEKGTKVQPLTDVFVSLCKKAGYEVIFPKDMMGLCCGMIWESKGMPDIADSKVRELEAALVIASDGGRIPVVCDQSPCLHRMREHIRGMYLYEPAEFIYEHLAQHLEFHRCDTPIAVHVTCSSRRMGLANKIIGLAQMCSSSVLVPAEVGCCGFAGDKGFTQPELNRWGLRKLKPQIEAAGVKYGYSNSRTCEIGLTTNSGIPYKSIVYLVDECTTPLNQN
ncbi:MAG: FAD-binding oxidoreductase [Muribaculaceae bacterium]|nr:FAD-binding oxidoreductase [Muribaculaceae bacterium]